MNEIGGIMSGTTDLINSAAGVYDLFSGHSNRNQYKYQLKLQKQAQKWQEQMSNTAHQRETADLQAAGLNPVLSAMGGNGASTGSVGAGSIGMGTTGADVANSISTARLAKAERENLEKQNELIDAQIDKTEAETKLTDTTNTNASTKTQQNINDENFAKTWWGRYISPAIRDMFGTGSAAAGAAAGAAVTNAATSARKARTPKRNKIGF